MHLIGISSNDWNGQWMNRQHMMWALKECAPVLYVQEPDPWSKGLRSRDERFFRATREQVHERLAVLRLPKVLAQRSRDGVWNQGTFERKAARIRRQVADLPRPRILYHWHPHLWRYSELLDPDVIVFHLYDLFPAHHEQRYEGTPGRRAFERMSREATIVLTGTPQQAAAVPRQDVHIVPNGVPYEWYRRPLPEPEELAGVPRPRIGYIGSLNSARDFDWLTRVADNPRWQLILAGCIYSLDPDDRLALERLRSRPNVTYLGELPSDRIPAVMQSLDVGLMCYRRGGIHEYASPIKLFEYCAAGLPVVGSRLEAIVANPESRRFVRFADTPDQAVAEIASVLAAAVDPADRQARRDFAADNSWSARARQVLALVEQQLAARSVRTSGGRQPMTEVRRA